MKNIVKNLNVAFGAISLYAASAQAMVPSFMAGLEDRPAVQQDNTCTNFDGEWKGTCAFEKNSIETAIVIRQHGCHTIDSGGFQVQIGGMTNSSSAGENGAHSMSISSDWNTDRTQLISHGVFSSRSLNGLPKGVDFKTSGTMDSILRLDQDKLIQEMKFNLNAGSANPKPVQVQGTCTFARK